MKEWINNIDKKIITKLMMGECLYDCLKQITNDIPNINHFIDDGWIFGIKLNNNTKPAIDKEIKTNILDKFGKYLDINFRLESYSKNPNLYLNIKIKFKRELKIEDYDALNGLLLLLGYGDRL